jgi:hypothetical protein
MTRRRNDGTRITTRLWLAVACLACSSSQEPAPAQSGTRAFALGFTDLPNAYSEQAIREAYDIVRRDGDLLLVHLDAGVPWQEALAGAAYHPRLESDLARRQSSVPNGHTLYVAATPLNIMRNALAPHAGAADNEPLTAPWDTASFANRNVITAYLAHARALIRRFRPTYFNYAIEANMLAATVPARWPSFLVLADSVYRTLKREFPAVTVFVSIQADFFHADPARQRTAVSDLLQRSDLVAVSTYPFANLENPTRLPADWFSAIAALAPAKPYAIAETGWPAEPVEPPAPFRTRSTPEHQRAYVARLLDDMQHLNARFVVWFVSRDYDSLYDTLFRGTPNEVLGRIWRDCGLFAGDGAGRASLGVWREWLAKPRGAGS